MPTLYSQSCGFDLIWKDLMHFKRKIILFYLDLIDYYLI